MPRRTCGERAFFSARVANAQILAEFKAGVQAIVDGDSNVAEQRLRLKQMLARLDYRPELGKEGTLEDLSSNARLNLMLRMNVSMVRNYGQWVAMNQPGALLASPALELIRISPRVNKRFWSRRWNSARADLGDATTATLADGGPQSNEINAFALKNDPIWPAISRFGLPYGPFDFGSGMGQREVGYRETVAVGVMKAGDDPIQPTPRGLNTGLAASLATMDEALSQALVQGLSADVEIVDGVLQFSNEGDELRERAVLVLDLIKDVEESPALTLRRRGQGLLGCLEEALCS